MAGPAYITVQQVRDAGITTSIIPDTTAGNAQITNAIALWQEFVERACKQWFYSKACDFRADGTDSDTLFFGVPIIDVTSLYINNCETPLDVKYYRINTSSGTSNLSTGRQNPYIQLVDTQQRDSDIYTAPLVDGKMLFRKGAQNQRIVGHFGHLDDDGHVPLLIQRALTKLVVEKLTNPIYAPGSSIVPSTATPGVILEEWSDEHKVKYQAPGGEAKARAPGLLGITNDPEVLGILKLFRAPIGIASPSNPTWR